MSQTENGNLDNMDDDYFDIAEFDDDPFEEENQSQTTEYSDFEDDDVNMNKQSTDTSAFEARNGRDIQGIPWERMNSTREKCREVRLKQYKNYENLPYSREEIQKECKEVLKGSTFFDFQFNTRLVKSTIVHFQLEFIGRNEINLSATELRSLLWATSKHDVYLMQNYSVMHWSSLLRRGKEVLNVAGSITPNLKRRGSLAQAISRVQISTMAVKNNLMVAGGFQGEIICKYLSQQGVAFCTKITNGENAITNAVDIYRSSNGSTQVMTANNDSHVRIFDTEKFALLNCLSFPWSVNNTSVSPDGSLFAILGDSTDCLITDTMFGKEVGTLKGHLDYSFASAWHPNGRILATGNQDRTCRLWDVRNLSKSFAVLQGRMGAIRSVRFTSDGRFMAMAEPADFVHIYDTMSDYCVAQEIDLFGEIAGISFSPDTEALFVGVADRTYGSLIEFNRRHCNCYLDSLI